MENTIHLQDETFEKAEIFDTPEQLAASMTEESAPQVEAQPEQPMDTPYVDPEAAPVEEPTTLEQITEASEPETQPQQEVVQPPVQEPQEEYGDEEIEAAVYTYLSEKLGREINSFEELNQQPAVDERVQAIADFVSETGRKPEDWFTYQSMNPSEMDDVTVVRVQMSQQYPNLSFEEINMLVGNKYKLDPNIHDEQDIQMSTLQLKIDAMDARGGIEKIRESYKAPLPQEKTTQPERGYTVDEDWMRNMATETEAMEALEFDLGGEKTFTYSLGDDHRRRLVQRNSQIDNFFDSYVGGDGSWDYDKMNSHFAVIDNIDTIVSSAYRQGLGDGQKAVVSNAANISTDTSPSQSQNLNQDNPLADQVRTLLRGGRSKTTFNI
tara:strand:+ start:89 stop:1231 length:1143 start_codon:yes stop_codon:yes gene_type:complete